MSVKAELSLSSPFTLWDLSNLLIRAEANGIDYDQVVTVSLTHNGYSTEFRSDDGVIVGTTLSVSLGEEE